MHFIDTEKKWCFLNLMFQMQSAPSVFYRKAGYTEEFLATVSYNLFILKMNFGGKENEKREKKREMKAKQTQKKFI